MTGEAEGQVSVSVTDGDIISISKKITMLEMKELNERQRAEHAARMYDQQRALLVELGTRNTELEEKFAEVCFLFFYSISSLFNYIILIIIGISSFNIITK